MKSNLVKISMAIMILASAVLCSSSTIVAAQSEIKAKISTPVVMTNNLSKYKLQVNVTLPLTTTIGGLSYTLHKMMMYDMTSADAKKLMKTYGYVAKTDYYPDAKYFVWTKITITNKSKYKMGYYPDDTNAKWNYITDTGRNFDPIMPLKRAWTYNDKSALWAYILKPGETITSYQAYAMNKDLTNIRLTMNFKGAHEEVDFATLVQ